MKKFVSAVLAFFVIFSLSACSGGASGSGAASSASEQEVSIESAEALLRAVWDSYAEDEKFAVAGGDFSEESMVTDAPGKFDVSNTDALDATLGFPAASADQIDEAASMVHMMNANTFTCGAFHVKDAQTLGDVAKALQENIQQRQWICGFPDKLVIAQVGDYIVSCFGSEEIVDTFHTKLAAAYPSAETLVDEPITA